MEQRLGSSPEGRAGVGQGTRGVRVGKISKDPVSEILQLISDEFIIRFKSYNLLTINFCGIYKTNEIGKFKVIFKIVNGVKND